MSAWQFIYSSESKYCMSKDKFLFEILPNSRRATGLFQSTLVVTSFDHGTQDHLRAYTHARRVLLPPHSFFLTLVNGVLKRSCLGVGWLEGEVLCVRCALDTYIPCWRSANAVHARSKRDKNTYTGISTPGRTILHKSSYLSVGYVTEWAFCSRIIFWRLKRLRTEIGTNA